jgi:hypothetical protein
MGVGELGKCAEVSRMAVQIPTKGSMGYMGVCVCQDSQNDTLKICASQSINLTTTDVKALNSFAVCTQGYAGICCV